LATLHKKTTPQANLVKVILVAKSWMQTKVSFEINFWQRPNLRKAEQLPFLATFAVHDLFAVESYMIYDGEGSARNKGERNG
jgi:hypothetical protein